MVGHGVIIQVLYETSPSLVAQFIGGPDPRRDERNPGCESLEQGHPEAFEAARLKSDVRLLVERVPVPIGYCSETAHACAAVSCRAASDQDEGRWSSR